MIRKILFKILRIKFLKNKNNYERIYKNINKFNCLKL